VHVLVFYPLLDVRVVPLYLMSVKQFPLADPLLCLLDALRHCKYMLQVLHGCHILRVPHVLITDVLQLCIQFRDS